MIDTPLWTLISLQIAMGCFDMLFHHELTERLAWRPTQRRELVLHGIRNLLYGVIFACLGCFAAQGAFAWLLAVLLLAELLITLLDFVEEDRSRALPASERVTHTLLALNYGAILALLTPVIAAWAALPTAIVVVDRGIWSPLMAIVAVGVAVFGVRDLLAARRLLRPSSAPPSTLSSPGATPMAVLVTGGTGFIGERLIAALVARGDRVTVLTRSPRRALALPTPIRIITSLDQIGRDERIDAIVNLAGEPIAGWLWTPAQRRRILDSRSTITRGLADLTARLKRTPRCLISGSAIGIYGTAAEEPVDETTPIIEDGSFAQALCLAWEAEARVMEAQGLRTVLLRTGLVLDSSGGTLARLLVPFTFGLGGPFADGRNWMSWITRDDLVRLILFCLDNPIVAGPVNGVAPHPVRNLAFVRALGRALRRPAFVPVPGFLLRAGLGDLGREIFLGSQNVLPRSAIQHGFTFRAASIEAALRQILDGPGAPTGQAPVARRSQPIAGQRLETVSRPLPTAD